MEDLKDREDRENSEEHKIESKKRERDDGDCSLDDKLELLQSVKKWKEAFCGLLIDAERGEGSVDLVYWGKFAFEDLKLHRCDSDLEWSDKKCEKACCEFM